MWLAEDGCDYKQTHEGAVQLLAQLREGLCIAERLVYCGKACVLRKMHSIRYVTDVEW